MQRIDLETAAQIHKVLQLCRSRGGDPVRVLDEGRLLRHWGTRREDAGRVLENAIAVIEALPGTRPVATPLDMKRMIIETLRGIQDDISAQS